MPDNSMAMGQPWEQHMLSGCVYCPILHDLLVLPHSLPGTSTPPRYSYPSPRYSYPSPKVLLPLSHILLPLPGTLINLYVGGFIARTKSGTLNGMYDSTHFYFYYY